MILLIVTAAVEVRAARPVSSPAVCPQDSIASPVVRDAWLAQDKAQHFVVSALLAGFGFAILREPLQRSEKQSFYLSGGLALSIGIGKEVSDLKKPKGHASFKDLVADFLGIGITLLLIKTI